MATRIKHPPVEVGKRYGKLVVIGDSVRHVKYRLRKCRCDCGSEIMVREGRLRSGQATKCHACAVAKFRDNTKHGHARGHVVSAEYLCWQSMNRRCRDTRSSNFKRYGGRGITVCERWRTSFKNFLDDMGFKPSPIHAIDRIDNAGDYRKENCRWATPKQQQRNTRRTKRLTINGITKTVAEWCEERGVSRYLVHGRIKLGWTGDRIFAQPKRGHA